MILEFVQGAALVLALCYLQTVNDRLWGERRLPARISSGVLFGVTCVIGMYLPVRLESGLIFDGRTVILSMAGLFGGPLVALIAGLMAASYRAWLGGVGTLVGIGNVILPVLLGLAYHALHRRGRLPITAWHLLLFGVFLHTLSLLLLAFLPAPLYARILDEVALPLVLVLSPALVLLGLLLQGIEQRRRTELDLRRSEARLSSISAAIPDLLMVIDEDGRYLEVISSNEQLLYAPSEALLGKRLHEVLPLGEAERFLHFIQNTLRSDSPQIIEYAMPTLGGDKVFECRAQRLDGVLGDKRAVVLLARDVTERAQLEMERRIAAIAFESSQGMIITDASTRILRVNQAFSLITGYAAEEVIGQPTRMLSSGLQGAEFYQGMWQSINQQGFWEGEIWNRRKSGEVFPEWLTISAVRDGGGRVVNYLAALTDISERKAAEDKIRRLAFFDPLTGLPNRRLLQDRLQQALADSQRSAEYGALMFLDLDNFKNINDVHGHQAGDQVLREAAERLKACVRGSDTVARLGGDEFVIMLEHLDLSSEESASQVEQIGLKILADLDRPYVLGELSLRSSASIGMVLFNDASDSVDELMKRADLSMYEAKTAGKNTLRFFDPQMQRSVSERLRLEESIRLGLQRNEFCFYIHPQYAEETGLLGGEVLVRWQHPQRGLLAPAAFIPLAERSGLVEELDFCMLRQACAQLARWAQQPALAGLSLAVNLSARLLYQDDFIRALKELLDSSGANPQRLKLELTESLLLNDMTEASARMTQLQALGIRFSIDDFGTGYSSMAYLQQLPLDQLKIDQSFVQGLPDAANSLAIVRAICALASSLNLEVIAEGVESEVQRQALLANGCRHYQGYLFGRPLPLAEFEALALGAQPA